MGGFQHSEGAGGYFEGFRVHVYRDLASPRAVSCGLPACALDSAPWPGFVSPCWFSFNK